MHEGQVGPSGAASTLHIALPDHAAALYGPYHALLMPSEGSCHSSIASDFCKLAQLMQQLDPVIAEGSINRMIPVTRA